VPRQLVDPLPQLPVRDRLIVIYDRRSVRMTRERPVVEVALRLIFPVPGCAIPRGKIRREGGHAGQWAHRSFPVIGIRLLFVDHGISLDRLGLEVRLKPAEEADQKLLLVRVQALDHGAFGGEVLWQKFAKYLLAAAGDLDQ
jgi:hypothetical protein